MSLKIVLYIKGMKVLKLYYQKYLIFNFHLKNLENKKQTKKPT